MLLHELRHALLGNSSGANYKLLGRNESDSASEEMNISNGAILKNVRTVVLVMTSRLAVIQFRY